MGVYAVNKQVIFSLLMSQASKEKPAECNDPPLEGPPEAYQGNFWSGIPRNSQIYSTGTVDGQNPAPVDMVNIPLFSRFHTSQVVQDFFHQQDVLLVFSIDGLFHPYISRLFTSPK